MYQLSDGRGTGLVRKVRTGHLLDSLQHMQDTRTMCKCFRASWRKKERPETTDANQVLATDTCACTVAAYEEYGCGLLGARQREIVKNASLTRQVPVQSCERFHLGQNRYIV